MYEKGLPCWEARARPLKVSRKGLPEGFPLGRGPGGRCGRLARLQPGGLRSKVEGIDFIRQRKEAPVLGQSWLLPPR